MGAELRLILSGPEKKTLKKPLVDVHLTDVPVIDVILQYRKLKLQQLLHASSALRYLI